MPRRQPLLPRVWLLSDARNDAVLEAALRRLPRGSGFVFRHGHLPPAERQRRWRALRPVARRCGHQVFLSGSRAQACRLGADGSYGAPSEGRANGRIVTVHSLREIAAARRSGALAMMLSPIHPTRSHPGARSLGQVRFLLLAARAGMPVIALGGMTARRARGLPVHGWAAIDGLSPRRRNVIVDANRSRRA